MAETKQGLNGKARRGKRISLQDLATAKRLDVEFLKRLGLEYLPGGGVAMPYYDETGGPIAVKRRTALRAKDGSYWPKETPLAAYGQWKLDEANRAGFCIIPEGESDCWALWSRWASVRPRNQSRTEVRTDSSRSSSGRNRPLIERLISDVLKLNNSPIAVLCSHYRPRHPGRAVQVPGPLHGLEQVPGAGRRAVLRGGRLAGRGGCAGVSWRGDR